jgi:hypothetical protein
MMRRRNPKNSSRKSTSHQTSNLAFYETLSRHQASAYDRRCSLSSKAWLNRGFCCLEPPQGHRLDATALTGGHGVRSRDNSCFACGAPRKLTGTPAGEQAGGAGKDSGSFGAPREMVPDLHHFRRLNRFGRSSRSKYAASRSSVSDRRCGRSSETNRSRTRVSTPVALAI